MKKALKDSSGRMRLIDRWIGIPICLVLDMINRVTGPFFRPKKGAAKNILFIKLSEMGSIILSYPLIKRVEGIHPGANIYFLTFKRNEPLFSIMDIVPPEKLFIINDGSVLSILIDTFKAIVKCRLRKIDLVFDLEFFARCTSIISYLSGAKRRVGFYKFAMEGLYRGRLHTHRVQYNPLLHISESFLSLAEASTLTRKIFPDLGMSVDKAKISIPLLPEPESTDGVKKTLAGLGIKDGSRIILIHAGEGNLPIREWAFDNYLNLCRRFLGGEDNYVILVGNESAAVKASSLHSALNDQKCINMAGKTSLKELFGLFYLARLLVSNDCGVAHLASLSPVKKIVLFGPESPRIFGPLDKNTEILYSNTACSPCLSVFNHRYPICKDTVCLKTLSVDTVYDMAAKRLKD